LKRILKINVQEANQKKIPNKQKKSIGFRRKSGSDSCQVTSGVNDQETLGAHLICLKNKG
jgi:chorismate synthase